jgi:hypothetical protein
MTSLRQIEANRKNSLLSTGPRSESGKDASKRNALKHGLAGDGVVLTEEVDEEVRQCYEQWAKEFGPATPYQEFLVEQIALNSVRLRQCSGQEIFERSQLSLRAALCWDDDRKLLAEQLGQNLSRRPALIAKQLERTPQGCDWLRGRWESLRRILEKNGDWSSAERSLALDLLGMPTELREDTSRLLGDLNAIVDQEVERLQARSEQLGPLDKREREKTINGRSVEPDARLLKTRRYEAQIRRALNWSMAQYFRVTLGYGLTSPTLGFPVPADDDTDADAKTETVARPGPKPAPADSLAAAAPVPAPTTPPEPHLFETRDAALRVGPPAMSLAAAPATALALAPAPRLASSKGTMAAALAPSPMGNRQARRAQASKARRA